MWLTTKERLYHLLKAGSLLGPFSKMPTDFLCLSGNVSTHAQLLGCTLEWQRSTVVLDGQTRQPHSVPMQSPGSSYSTCNVWRPALLSDSEITDDPQADVVCFSLLSAALIYTLTSCCIPVQWASMMTLTTFEFVGPTWPLERLYPMSVESHLAPYVPHDLDVSFVVTRTVA